MFVFSSLIYEVHPHFLWIKMWQMMLMMLLVYSRKSLSLTFPFGQEETKFKAACSPGPKGRDLE